MHVFFGARQREGFDYVMGRGTRRERLHVVKGAEVACALWLAKVPLLVHPKPLTTLFNSWGQGSESPPWDEWACASLLVIRSFPLSPDTYFSIIHHGGCFPTSWVSWLCCSFPQVVLNKYSFIEYLVLRRQALFSLFQDSGCIECKWRRAWRYRCTPSRRHREHTAK